ncbi:hypothetical protein CCACVL1_08957 [Corchorus capsularis]|uniref:Uncharacterized protein n=1 Tax=Corchorus capsularis TaxID=210143 RepID=A0A1R3IYC6_COCAP|nr:hypothetical protein CCACVL1_08957 [Corchorus capsularis]
MPAAENIKILDDRHVYSDSLKRSG